MDCGTPGFPVLHYLPEFAHFMYTESVMLSNHLILCHPLHLPSIFPSIPWSFPVSWFFASGGQRIWASASVLPMNIQCWFFFRIEWFNLLTAQWTRKSLLQHHNSKPSVFWCPAFFMVQLSHLYKTTRKTKALTMWPLWAKYVSAF